VCHFDFTELARTKLYVIELRTSSQLDGFDCCRRHRMALADACRNDVVRSRRKPNWRVRQWLARPGWPNVCSVTCL